jgi:hypothetical protein
VFVSVKQMDKTCPKATLSANRFIALSLNTGLFLCEVLYKKARPTRPCLCLETQKQEKQAEPKFLRCCFFFNTESLQHNVS